MSLSGHQNHQRLIIKYMKLTILALLKFTGRSTSAISVKCLSGALTILQEVFLFYLRKNGKVEQNSLQ